MTLDQRAEILKDKMKGDCDVCPCLKRCLAQLDNWKDSNCKKELKKLLKELT